MASGETVLRVSGLCKRYSGNRVDSLQDVRFSIHSGECVGLVGANGAGKSTLLKILVGLVRASSGTYEWFPQSDSDCSASSNNSQTDSTAASLDFVDSRRLFQKVSYVPELPGLWPEFSGYEFLELCLQPIAKTSHISSVLKVLGLAERAHRPMGGYSKGMLQRVLLAKGLLAQPKIFLLDEVMSGLDPFAQSKLSEVLQQLKLRGASLVLSSHSLNDLERLADRILVIERGRLVRDGPASEVIAELRHSFQSAQPWDEEPMGDIRELWGPSQ